MIFESKFVGCVCLLSLIDQQRFFKDIGVAMVNSVAVPPSTTTSSSAGSTIGVA